MGKLVTLEAGWVLKRHGKFLYGHDHEMLTPGELGSGHTSHIRWNDVPKEYLKIPDGVQYTQPLGNIK